MVIISKSKLVSFYEVEPKAKEPLLKWYYETLFSDWSNFSDVKKTFNSVDAVGNDHFVFNIGGNKYRLVAMVHFSKRTLSVYSIYWHTQAV